MDQDKANSIRSSKYEQLLAVQFFQKYEFRFFSIVFFKHNS